MRRREFIAGLGGAAASQLVSPLAAQAQQAPLPVIGFVHSASAVYFAPFAASFHEGLNRSGYVEHRNVEIEYRWAEGRYERLPALVADLVSRRVSVIFAAGGTDPAKDAKAATSTIPVIFISAVDPVTSGLVASLNRPGGNVTGVSMLATALAAKELELMHQLVPSASAIGAIVNPNYPGARSQMDEFQRAAGKLGVRGILISASSADEIDAGFEGMAREGAKGVLVANDPFLLGRREQLVALAARYGIPAIYTQRQMVIAGGLASYGANFADGYRQAGIYIGRVLKGERPADLPIVQPTKFELAINLRTARTLGIDIPPALLATADEVIE